MRALTGAEEACAEWFFGVDPRGEGSEDGAPAPGGDDGCEEPGTGKGSDVDVGVNVDSAREDDEAAEDDDEGDELSLAMLAGDGGGAADEDGPPAVGNPEDHTAARWDDDLRDTLDRRDARIADYDGGATHDLIRDQLRQSGTARDVREALADLGTREEPATATEGSRLDMRNVVRRLAGDTTVRDYYQRPRTRAGDDIAVGISLDMSGSMSHDEGRAKGAVGAFLHGVQQLGGEVVANAWRYDSAVVKVHILTGPYERFRWEHLDACEPGGGDPIGAGMADCARMLDQCRADETILVTITDGRPGVVAERPTEFDDAEAEAAAIADDLRDRGLTVLGFGFGHVDENALERMFDPEFAHHVPLDELADALVEAFADHHQPLPTV